MPRLFRGLALGALVLVLVSAAMASDTVNSNEARPLAKDDSAGKTDDARADKKKPSRRKEGAKTPETRGDRTQRDGKGPEKSVPAQVAPASKPALSGPVAKDEKKPAEAKPATAKDAKDDGEKSKPATYKLKKRPWKIEINLDGIFEGRTMAEIAMHGKEWSDFEVLKAMEHGAAVKAGDFLIAFNTERIDRAIADLQRDLAVAKIAFQEAELQVQLLQSTVPLDLASSDRLRRVSEEDYEQFLKVDRPLSQRLMDFMVKVSEDNLSYEKEELRQLEKMYKADDLVEETEEIILKRTRDSVARATFNLERMKTERETVLKLTLPRAEESIKLNRQRQEIDWKRSHTTIPNAKRRAELALEKLKIEGGRSEERLQRLLADRTWMTYKAPVTGIVYYGRCTRGKWSNLDTAFEKLRRGGHVMNEDVFMTIVEPRPLVVRTTIPERHIQHVKPGMKGIVQPTGFPDAKLTAIVDRINAAPFGSQGFDAVVNVALDESSPPVVPGMTCELRIVPYRKSEALTIPAAALGTDDQDPLKYHVCVPGKDGKPDKRPVTIGKRADKQVEILKGLAEGDEILAECPKE